jgi:hypothetical protein
MRRLMVDAHRHQAWNPTLLELFPPENFESILGRHVRVTSIPPVKKLVIQVADVMQFKFFSALSVADHDM